MTPNDIKRAATAEKKRLREIRNYKYQKKTPEQKLISRAATVERKRIYNKEYYQAQKKTGIMDRSILVGGK